MSQTGYRSTSGWMGTSRRELLVRTGRFPKVIIIMIIIMIFIISRFQSLRSIASSCPVQLEAATCGELSTVQVVNPYFWIIAGQETKKIKRTTSRVCPKNKSLCLDYCRQKSLQNFFLLLFLNDFRLIFCSSFLCHPTRGLSIVTDCLAQQLTLN